MLLILERIQHELMLFAAVGFIIGSSEELFIDILWIIRYFWRRLFVYSRYPTVTAVTLQPSPRSGCIAVFVPAWDEAQVIGPMLRHCIKCWSGENFHLFVGCYSNDPATIIAVLQAAAGDRRILPVFSARPGPTTKGDCLNSIWAAMERQEAAQGYRFKAVLLHDAEDVVHPAEIRVFDTLIDRFDLVQIPVFPLVNPKSRWVAGHYCDEFAESHGKCLIVREAVGAAMPAAGVGCAFSRDCIGRIAEKQGGAPFDPVCLTEDYELGLRVGELGGRGIFVRMPDGAGGIVCTREYFPARLDAAVKQKARWITGIALAGWDRLGWHGSFTERWMRLRDRRALLAAVILCAAYAALVLYGVTGVTHIVAGTTPHPFSRWLALLLVLNGLLLLWRIGMRWMFVTRFYGWREGMRSIPRNFIANIIAIMAARRAVCHYAKIRRGARPLWEKTAHHFPEELAQAT